jgi:5-dehydro-4-deoxyglucarate dehydratase
MLDGVLFFPVTPFGPDGSVDLVAFSGGPLPVAQSCARAAKEAGADGLLLLPPYLVSSPQSGLVAYARAVAAAAPLPLILYSRDNAKFGVGACVELASIANVIGYKDGSGDLATVAGVVSSVRASLEGTSKAFLFFNGLPTAELTVLAYRAIGVDRYSSAVFCFAPEISLAFYDAVVKGDTEMTDRLLSRFYRPFAVLRDQVPGFAVALVKAAVRLRGLDAGGVRPPLVDPSAGQIAQLEAIIDEGLAALAAVGG